MLAPSLPEEDLEDFLDKVNQVSLLVDGLKGGTISPDYVDSKYIQKPDQSSCASSSSSTAIRSQPLPNVQSKQILHGKQPELPAQDAASENADQNCEREDRLRRKFNELKANYERKQKARAKYADYVNHKQASQYGTDYTQWDMWCPEDEEDDMINSIAPNEQFKAMEKDIDARHKRMVEQRQVAERQRVAGNEAFKKGQYSEALRCYEVGLEYEKTNMALHANAALAALKLKCYVQAVEHSDKVLHIAEFLHDNLEDPLCVKALQRRATAYTALNQLSKAAADLQQALQLQPNDQEVKKQLQMAERDLEEQHKHKQIKTALAKGAAVDDTDLKLDLSKLRKVEQLVSSLLQSSTTTSADMSTATTDSCGDVSSASGSVMKASSSTVCAVSTKNSTGISAGGHKTADVTSSSSDGGMPGTTNGHGSLSSTNSSFALNGNGSHSTDPSSTSLSQGVSHTTKAGTQGPKLPPKKTPPKSAGKLCQELQQLLQNDDGCCIYFRECGGLKAAAQEVAGLRLRESSKSSSSLAPLLSLLNAACANDVNLELLPSLGILSGCCKLLVHQESQVSSAAAVLLCTLASNDKVRQLISKELAAVPGPVAVLQQACSTNDASLQMLLLTLLSNCSVDSPVRAAMAGAFKQPDMINSMKQLLCHKSPGVQEKLLTLYGNLSGDSSLRQEIQQAPDLVSSIADLVCSHTTSTTGSRVCRAAATTLFNIVVDTPAQLTIASSAPHLTGLVQLLQHEDEQVVCRAAGILSRVAKQPAAQQFMLRSEHIEKLMAVCNKAVGEMIDEQEDRSAQIALLDACARVLAILSADGTKGSAQALVDAGCLAVMLKVVRMSKASEAMLGNAALCLGNIAKFTEFAAELHRLDAVSGLVKVAYDGKGNMPSKNAAIALARMSHFPDMMARLRELHGIEIIYQYVKP